MWTQTDNTRSGYISTTKYTMHQINELYVRWQEWLTQVTLWLNTSQLITNDCEPWCISSKINHVQSEPWYSTCCMLPHPFYTCWASLRRMTQACILGFVHNPWSPTTFITKCLGWIEHVCHVPWEVKLWATMFRAYNSYWTSTQHMSLVHHHECENKIMHFFLPCLNLYGCTNEKKESHSHVCLAWGTVSLPLHCKDKNTQAWVPQQALTCKQSAQGIHTKTYHFDSRFKWGSIKYRNQTSVSSWESFLTFCLIGSILDQSVL